MFWQRVPNLYSSEGKEAPDRRVRYLLMFITIYMLKNKMDILQNVYLINTKIHVRVGYLYNLCVKFAVLLMPYILEWHASSDTGWHLLFPPETGRRCVAGDDQPDL